MPKMKKKPCNLSIPMLNLPLRKAVLKRVSEWVRIVNRALHKPKKDLIDERCNCFLELFEEEMSDSFELLGTNGINNGIEEIFKDEQKFIYILSPYLDFSDKMKAILTTSSAKINIIWRNETEEKYNKNDDKNQMQSTKERIDGYKNYMKEPEINFHGIPNFHSKAYITSKALIITSLNLFKVPYNFELGVIFKDASYNKLVKKLYKELELLFEMNNKDIKHIENLKILTIDDLFEEIQKKNEKYEKDFRNPILFGQFSKQMMEKFPFTREEKWKSNENMISRHTRINRDMYDWALNNIQL